MDISPRIQRTPFSLIAMPEEPSGHGQMTTTIELQAIDPSPFQRHQHFEEDKLKGLAASIQQDGFIQPIVVRANGERYRLLQGREDGGPSETIRIWKSRGIMEASLRNCWLA